MLLRLFLLFTIVPLVELWLLIRFSQWTSIWAALAVVIATGVIGAALARWQGWQAWREIQRQLAAGQLPTEAMQDGIMILLAGALLITPGLLSDLAGIALLTPPIRRMVRGWLVRRFAARAVWQVRSSPWSSGANPWQKTPERGFADAAFDENPSGEPPRHRVIDVRVVDGEDDDTSSG